MSIIKRVLLLCVLFSCFLFAESVSKEQLPLIKSDNVKIHFTQEEQDYLADKKEIIVCDHANWMPYVGHDDTHTFGILYDHYKAFESKIGVPIRFVRASGTAECAQKVSEGQADVVSTISNAPNIFVNIIPSNTYGQDFIALTTRLETPFVAKMTDLKGKPIGIFGQYKNLIAYLRKIYPSLLFQETDSTEDALNKVINGELYGFIDLYRVAAYTIQREHIGELKINTKVGQLVTKAHVGIRSDNTLLKNIFNKAIADLSMEEKTRMIDHWMRAKQVVKHDYVLEGQIVAIALLIILGLLYYHLKERHRQKVLLAQQAKLAGMGTMINNVAHQWRQPLNRINSNIAVINSILYSETFDRNLIESKMANIKNSTQYMSDTIEDFSNYFSPNKKQTRFILEESLKKALKLMGSRTKDIDITISSSKDVWINSYEKEFQQVILILLNNAIDNFESKLTTDPKIDIVIKERNEKVSLSIHDNGGGIKEQNIDRIFEPYYSTKFSNKGTGLGLYMAKMLIEGSMSGHLSVENRNYGAYFEIKLPKRDSDA